MTAARRYPAAPRLSLVELLHGRPVADPYRWLEDPADPGTREWLAAQRELYEQASGGWEGRERWESALTALAAPARTWVPAPRGARVFYRRQARGQELPDLMVREQGGERVLLSPLALDPSGGTVLEAWRPSLEGGLLAYQVSVGGAEDSALWVMDVATGQIVDGPIDRVRRSPVAWLPDGAEFYYVRRLPPGSHPGEERYHRRVCLHRVGTDPDGDAVVFGDGRSATEFYDVAVSGDGRWLTITAAEGSAPGAGLWIADLRAGPRELPLLTAVHTAAHGRSSARIRPGTDPGGVMWLRTTCGAPRGRIVACAPGDTHPGRWREVIPERPDAVLNDLAVLEGQDPAHPVGLVSWARHAVAEITVHDLADGRELAAPALPGAGWVSAFAARPEGGREAWFAYTDHATPQTVLRYDAGAGRARPWPVPPPGHAAPGGLRPAPPGNRRGVAARQVTFPSRDGTIIRMFVLSPAGRPDRPRPAILTGYGGFGAPMSPAYLPEAIAWAGEGGVYAVACLRGGGEEGQEWHLAGRGARKQNVFDDFDAAADCLVAEGWTSAAQLGIMGGSNGGLLVGAALTQHPEKYAAAVCLAPLLDMVRYELSGMGPSWRTEYGTAADPDGLRVLLGYSPYHRVREGARYPAVMLAAFSGDTRVDPLHARKMCAALQHATSGDGPVLLRWEEGVGHGARAASRETALRADCLAFLGDRLGISAGGPRP